MVRRRTIWDIASSGGISCAVVSWLVTWPAETPPCPLVTDRAFAVLEEKGMKSALQDSTLWGPAGIADLFGNALTDSTTLAAEDEFTGRIALRLLQRLRPSLLAACFRDVDAAQHLYWDHFEPHLYRRGGDEFSRRIPEAYARFDRIAGELIHVAGPDAIVLVVSDHGHGPWFTWFGRGTPGGHTNSPDGIFIAAGPGIRQGRLEPAPSCLDIAPTLLSILGMPIAQDLDGRVIHEVFDEGSGGGTHQIASYENVKSMKDETQRSVEVLSSSADAEILRSLKTLGYIR
jgi:hypothetical protein